MSMTNEDLKELVAVLEHNAESQRRSAEAAEKILQVPQVTRDMLEGHIQSCNTCRQSTEKLLETASSLVEAVAQLGQSVGEMKNARVIKIEWYKSVWIPLLGSLLLFASSIFAVIHQAQKTEARIVHNQTVMAGALERLEIEAGIQEPYKESPGKDKP